MKKTALVLGLLLIGLLAYSQTCCPYINYVVVSPSAPNDTQQVQIFISVTTPALGTKMYLNHNIQGFSLNIQGCYFSGMLPALQTYIDTIAIGTLPAGNYTLHFLAMMSVNDSECVAVDSNQYVHTFLVSPSGAVSVPEGDLLPEQVFINRENKTFYIKTNQTKALVVHNMLGQVVYKEDKYFATFVSYATWPAGTYVVEFGDYVAKFFLN